MILRPRQQVDPILQTAVAGFPISVKYVKFRKSVDLTDPTFKEIIWKVITYNEYVMAQAIVFKPAPIFDVSTHLGYQWVKRKMLFACVRTEKQ